MITIGCKSLAPLCKDYEFVVNDKLLCLQRETAHYGLIRRK